jgi:hypothetical protein
MHCVHCRLLAAALVFICASAQAQHVSLWGGGGLGTFLTGGSGAGDPNASRITILAISVPGDDAELRALKGTLERPRGIPTNVAPYRPRQLVLFLDVGIGLRL